MSLEVEIGRALRGAVGLARRDPTALASFDFSVAGFWRSFIAAGLAAPAFFLFRGLSQAAPTDGEPAAGSLLRDLLSYGLGWLTLPIVGLLLTPYFNLSNRFVPLVVAANWAALLQSLLFSTVLLATAGLPAGMGQSLLAATAILVLLYEWQVVRTALGSTAVVAAGFVASDVVLSLLFDTVLQRLRP